MMPQVLLFKNMPQNVYMDSATEKKISTTGLIRNHNNKWKKE